jgi:hypothetical protein
VSYLRCQCCGGDVPHTGAAVHKRIHSRCTRVATVQIRRTVTTEGKPNTSRTWFDYCESCAKAIEAYQGSEVERRV